MLLTNMPDEAELDEAQIAAEVLATEVPVTERLITPAYYIDSFTDPWHPIYFENGRYEIRYNEHTGAYFTLVDGYRLIVFHKVDGDVLVKTADLDLNEHRFTYADIFTPEMLTYLVSQHTGMDVDEFIAMLNIPDLLYAGDNEMNAERIMAEVFGKPLYEWGWYIAGSDYGLEIINNLGVMMMRLVDEEGITARLSKRKRRKAQENPWQQLGFAVQGF